jgi:hypothetical protein
MLTVKLICAVREVSELVQVSEFPVVNGLSAKQIHDFHWASVSRNANHDAPAERPMEIGSV